MNKKSIFIPNWWVWLSASLIISSSSTSDFELLVDDDKNDCVDSAAVKRTVGIAPTLAELLKTWNFISFYGFQVHKVNTINEFNVSSDMHTGVRGDKVRKIQLNTEKGDPLDFLKTQLPLSKEFGPKPKDPKDPPPNLP